MDAWEVPYSPRSDLDRWLLMDGAWRRRRCEWGRPYTLSWRPAPAGDAGWMPGKSRTRLAPILTGGSSWMPDRRAQRLLPTRANSRAFLVSRTVPSLRRARSLSVILPTLHKVEQTPRFRGPSRRQ